MAESTHRQAALTSQTKHRACSACNKKKTKCDMDQPRCALCVRTGTDCVYPTKRKPRDGVRTTNRASKQPAQNGTTNGLIQLFETHQPLMGQDLSPGAALPAAQWGVESITGQQAACTAGSIASASQNLSTAPQNQLLRPSMATAVAAEATTSNILLHQLSQPPPGTSPGDCSNDIAAHLVDLFFDHVQPWLPMLHKPRFQSYLHEKLRREENALASLDSDEVLLLMGMFALSSRFLPGGSLLGFPSLQWQEAYAAKAATFYKQIRDSDSSFTLTFLQGTIAFAVYSSSCGLSARGWILVGVCVRMAYELGLSELDSADDGSEPQMDWTLMEERRRAWWLVWELDTFSSYVRRKPYAVNKRAISVALPASDEAWFRDEKTLSVSIPTEDAGSWSDLKNCENQNERAWYLAATELLSQSAECLLQHRQLNPERLCVLQNNVSCFRLALPSIFRRESDTPQLQTLPVDRSNWITGTHMALSTASYLVSCLALLDSQGRPPRDTKKYSEILQARAFDIAYLVWRWPMQHVRYAHPFYSLLFLTPHVSFLEPSPTTSVTSSSMEVVKLIQSCIGEFWNIGTIAERIQKLCLKQDLGEMNFPDIKLVNRYSVWFSPTMQRCAAALVAEETKSQRQELSLNGPGISETVSRTTYEARSLVENQSPSRFVFQNSERPIDNSLDLSPMWDQNDDYSDLVVSELFEELANEDIFTHKKLHKLL